MTIPSVGGSGSRAETNGVEKEAEDDEESSKEVEEEEEEDTALEGPDHPWLAPRAPLEVPSKAIGAPLRAQEGLEKAPRL